MITVANIYLIKDLSRLSGHSIHTLKFYLKLGLIHEVGRSPQTHFRYFDDTTLAALAQIRALRKERQSLAQIHQRLHHGSSIQKQGSTEAIVPSGSLAA